MIVGIGKKVKIVYRAFEGRKEYEAVVKKQTPSGLLRIETIAKEEDGKPVYSELFHPVHNGYARGWNTLWWEEIK